MDHVQDESALIDIKEAVEKTLCRCVTAHVLSGCDTVSCLWGIRKVTLIKVLKSGEKSLCKLGNTRNMLMTLKINTHHLLHRIMDTPREQT